MKTLIIIFFIHTIMIAGCHSGQNLESSGDPLPEVIYNGEIINLTNEQVEDITNMITTLFLNCDDLYELIVTNSLIDKLKAEKQYLEIIYPQTLSLDAGKFGKHEMKKVFIPLTGKFASSDQVTFFYGISDYSNTPFSIAKGSAELIALIKDTIP